MTTGRGVRGREPHTLWTPLRVGGEGTRIAAAPLVKHLLHLAARPAGRTGGYGEDFTFC
jgi:hypothetical protein